MTKGYEGLRERAAWLDLGSRGRIVAKGRDRSRFLHAITSNEIKKLMPGRGCYAFLLSAQGRIQADLTLFCQTDQILIDVEPDLREKVPAHIRRFIVADQVELQDVTASTVAIGLEGPGAAAVLAAIGAPAAPESYAHVEWNGFTVAGVSVTGQPGVRFYGPAEARDGLIAMLEKAGAVASTAEDARLVRIENGKPVFGADIRDTSLPQETGQMHGVSFQKGCYLGQEIVERIRAKGHVNRTLQRIVLEGPEPPAPGATVTVDGAEAEVTSAIVSPATGQVVALAYVRQR
jgi:tRNA-modifying protein YgfZ